jgi:hypothetical protein
MGKLFAFWRCHDFPYLEGVEVEKVDPEAEPCRLPAFIVPLEDGQRIEAELDTLRQVYKIELHKLEETWFAQVQGIVPGSLLRLSPAEPEPEHVPTWRWPAGVYVKGTRIEVTSGPHAGKRGTTIEPIYSDPMAVLDDGGDVVEFHRPEDLRLLDGHEEEAAPPEPDTQSLTLVTMLKLSQAGIITKGPDADADGLSFCLTPKGGKLLGELIEAARTNDAGVVKAIVRVRPEENPAVDGQLPDIKFVKKDEPDDVECPYCSRIFQTSDEGQGAEPDDVECPYCSRIFQTSDEGQGAEQDEQDEQDRGQDQPPPAPAPAELAAGLKDREKAVLLLCRKSRSVKFMGTHSRYTEGTLYKVKCELVGRGLVTEALVREANSKAKLWCLTDAGRAVVVELLKERNPK